MLKINKECNFKYIIERDLRLRSEDARSLIFSMLNPEPTLRVSAA